MDGAFIRHPFASYLSASLMFANWLSTQASIMEHAVHLLVEDTTFRQSEVNDVEENT